MKHPCLENANIKVLYSTTWMFHHTSINKIKYDETPMILMLVNTNEDNMGVPYDLKN